MLAELGKVGVELLDPFLVGFQEFWPSGSGLGHLQELDVDF